MPGVLIRNLSEETHRALKARAAKHGNSTGTEIRLILEDAVSEEVPGVGKALAPQKGLGTLLYEWGRKYGTIPEVQRDKSPIEPAIFE